MARPKGSKNKPKYPEHVKYREDWVEEWLLLVAGGRTINEIYNSDRDRFPTPATVGQWLMKHDSFYEKYMKAKRIGAEIDADYIRYIADSCDEGSTGAVQKARLQVDTRMKILSKLLPGTYGERVQVEQTVDDKRSLDNESLESAISAVERKFFDKKTEDKEETVQ